MSNASYDPCLDDVYCAFEYKVDDCDFEESWPRPGDSCPNPAEKGGNYCEEHAYLGRPRSVVKQRMSKAKVDKFGRDSTYATEQEKITGARHSFWNAYSRCNYPKRKNYLGYGAKGVEMRFKSSSELIEHIGPRPSPRHKLDRFNPYGHYESGNVHWSVKLGRRRKRTAAPKELKEPKVPKVPKVLTPYQIHSARMGRLGAHRRYHKGEGIEKPGCEFCFPPGPPNNNGAEHPLSPLRAI